MIMNESVCENSNPYFLTVPINAEGIEDAKYMREETPNTHEFVIPPTEFENMWNSGVFSKINQEFGLLIDTYEDEEIPMKYCARCLDIVRSYGFQNSYFATALKEALNYGTSVICDF
ncbi:hypothetical protein [Faecalibaculum rodentium]|uniref:hypothetical protein n=1 Tax=Faecalibaculum rodentium TaxID=1702221 RepID=UPI003F67E26A